MITGAGFVDMSAAKDTVKPETLNHVTTYDRYSLRPPEVMREVQVQTLNPETQVLKTVEDALRLRSDKTFEILLTYAIDQKYILKLYKYGVCHSFE